MILATGIDSAPFATTVAGLITGIAAPLMVLAIATLIRQVVKLGATMDVLSQRVDDMRTSGADRLVEINRQAKQNERIALLSVGIGLVGWALRGWLPARHWAGK